MHCLVTGVAGFVGSHLAERLLADGHEVWGIDSFIDYYPRYMKERNLAIVRSYERFHLIEGDLLTLDLPRLLEGIDWIFHQAAQAGVRASWGKEFERYVNCNVLATQKLLEATRHATGIRRRFVYASSSSVYGNTTVLPISEALTPRPVSPYGATKLAAENLCFLYHQNFGVSTVSLRYFSVYGPRQRPDMAFHHFCKAVLDHKSTFIYGDGSQTRDFTYISDVVEANIRAATSDAAVGKVINIAGGSRVTLHQVLQMLQDVSQSTVHVVFNAKQFGDVDHTYADTSLARQLLDYRPQVSLREGLAREFADIALLYEHVKGNVPPAA
jgi:nucleoside-diphosphate-sugar epimerase